MAILTNDGRALITQLMSEQAVFMAWGNGEESWGTTSPLPAPDSSALKNAVGFRKAAQIRFCEPDNAGVIEVSSGKFSFTDTPGRHLYLQFRFDFADGEGETIKELGIFFGTLIQSGLPDGQQYFAPSEIEHSGSLVMLEHPTALVRETGVRETFEFVVTF